MKYGSGSAPDLLALRTLADAAFTSATKEVVINMSAGPLGTTGGIVKFDKSILLDAAMTVLRETDPNFVQPPPAATFADFSRGCLET